MDIREHGPDQRPWRVLGEAGGAKISVAPPTSIRIEACGLVAVVPLPLVLALQTAEARAFLSDPAVVPFMYAANDRESRIRAAKLLASKGLAKSRRELVDALTKQHGLSEVEAWDLARLKYPLDL